MGFFTRRELVDPQLLRKAAQVLLSLQKGQETTVYALRLHARVALLADGADADAVERVIERLLP